MIEFISAPENQVFTVAIGLMMGIALIEGVFSIIGMGFSSALDTLLPDIDIDFDVDMDVDGGGLHGASGLHKLLGWLYVGKVPALILFVTFLTFFGLMGYVTQFFSIAVLDRFLPTWLASVPALVLALPITRGMGAIFSRIIPKDETSAVSSKSFVGKVAVITLGTARQGSAAEAKLQDKYGQTHYVMVEPESEGVSFTQGDEVLLLEEKPAHFTAILNTHEALENFALDK